MEFLRLRLTQWGQIISEVFRAGFFGKNYSLNALKFSLVREADTKLDYCMMKLIYFQAIGESVEFFL